MAQPPLFADDLVLSRKVLDVEAVRAIVATTHADVDLADEPSFYYANGRWVYQFSNDNIVVIIDAETGIELSQHHDDTSSTIAPTDDPCGNPKFMCRWDGNVVCPEPTCVLVEPIEKPYMDDQCTVEPVIDNIVIVDSIENPCVDDQCNAEPASVEPVIINSPESPCVADSCDYSPYPRSCRKPLRRV